MLTSNHSTEVDLELRQPLGETVAAAALPGWLSELREMRARIFYEGGLRPRLRNADGTFDDPDPTDTSAFHVVARCAGEPSGYARIIPSILPEGWIGSVLGKDLTDRILREFGADRARCFEASRWVVTPEHRGPLGPLIVAASWAVARWLKLDFGFV